MSEKISLDSSGIITFFIFLHIELNEQTDL